MSKTIPIERFHFKFEKWAICSKIVQRSNFKQSGHISRDLKQNLSKKYYIESTLTFRHHHWTKSPRGANRENGSGLSSWDWSRDRSLNHPFLLQISPDRDGLKCNRPRPVAAAGWIAGPTLCHGSQLALNTTIWIHKQWHDINMEST